MPRRILSASLGQAHLFCGPVPAKGGYRFLVPLEKWLRKSEMLESRRADQNCAG
jgi:hypothetical protein